MDRTPENAAFAKLLGEEFVTDEERAEFERDVAKLVAGAEVIGALEEVRAALGIPKAEVARRIGAERSVVARLLSGQTTNATLTRVVEVVGAMDCYMEIRIKPQPKVGRHPLAEIETQNFHDPADGDLARAGARQ